MIKGLSWIDLTSAGKVCIIFFIKRADHLLNMGLQVRVNGPDAAPVYKFLKASKPGLFGSRIKWNFTKFLVDKNGKVIDRYATSTAPMSIEVSIAPSPPPRAHMQKQHLDVVTHALHYLFMVGIV